MWHLLLSTAVASTGDEVAAAAAPLQEGMALACAPAGRLFTVASKLPLPPAILQEMDENGRALLALLDPEKAAAAGLDREGTILMAADKGATPSIRLPFAGTRAQADSLLRQLYTDVEDTGNAWKLHAKGKPFTAVMDDRTLRVGPADGTAGPKLDVPPAVGGLTAGLPDVPGCAVYLKGVPLPKAKGPMDLVTFVPLSGGSPLIARLRGATPAPTALAQGGLVGDVAHTTETPTAILTVGVPMDSLIDMLAKEFSASDLADFHSIASFGSGAAVAFFGNPRDRRFAATLPLTAPDGSALNPKKVARVVVKVSEGTLKRAGATGFRGEFEGTELVGSVEKGRVILASDGELLADLRADGGVAWVTPEMRTWIQAWPVSVQTASTGQAAARLGVRTAADYWELSAEVTGVPPEMAGMMTGMLGALAGPNFVEMQLRARRSEAPNTVDEIRAAQLAWLTDHGRALPLPAAPRAPDAMGKEQVPWVPQPEWLQLGWSPTGDLRGSYSVEVSGDGKSFKVIGVIDADGDGIPAVYEATDSTPAEQKTDPKVY